jgi:hypothetical protein
MKSKDRTALSAFELSDQELEAVSGGGKGLEHDAQGWGWAGGAPGYGIYRGGLRSQPGRGPGAR